MRYLFIILIILVGCLRPDPPLPTRLVEGGSDTVQIDTKTKLKHLISRIDSDWKLVFTGKGYWIGYTDDMYSIAAHGTKAIDPLVKLMNETNSLKTKEGVLYSLHLIGIQSNTIGRFKEEFVDTLARKAILSKLVEPELHELAISLLMRDPWFFDIPYFMHYLTIPDQDYSFILSALKRYNFPDKPFNQKLSKELDRKIKIFLPDGKTYFNNNIMKALQQEYGENIIIDSNLYDLEENYNWKIHWIDSTQNYSESYCSEILNQMTMTIGSFLYCNFDSRYFYSIKGNEIYLMGKEKARIMWLDWWKLTGNKKITAANMR